MRLLTTRLAHRFSNVSATEIIEQFKALPAKERAEVARFIVENDDSWIPESFKQGMADAEAGRLVDLDTALNQPYPGDGMRYRFYDQL
jgi:predicted transcriptional regulator